MLGILKMTKILVKIVLQKKLGLRKLSHAVVQYFTVDFHQILKKFNNLPPGIEPTATGHIIEQIN